ncbi:hypothetical protein [Brucella intermedia]|uniref:hypothetical protein n=1 Tax=Brucella intermedia TaxID=94625 RepID=UPI00124C7E09|nr:hypothetical protein [Brucella intermedia]KAB2716965.1 hypothetical protein F9K75_12915 [Brucella intermedia]
MTERKQISKLDAARRQLLAAIHIHWYMDEPIAVYSLAANVWEICDALLARQNKIRILAEITSSQGIMPRAVRDLINAPRNFVKHADRDPDTVIDDLSHSDCDAILLTACLDYMFANGRSPYCAGVFVAWYSAIYPEKTELFFRSEAEAIFAGLAAESRERQVQAARDFLSRPPKVVLNDVRNELTDNYRWSNLKQIFGQMHYRENQA